MSDPERGAYAPPTDPPLSFDPRQPARGSQPLPFTLIVSVLVLAALAAVIFVFYRSGVREAGQAPQVVGTPMGGIKAPAPAEPPVTDPAAGLEIYKADAAAAADAPPAEPQFTPPPEQPQPRAAAVAPAPVIRPPLAANMPAPAPTKVAPAPVTVIKSSPPKPEVKVAAAPTPPKAVPLPKASPVPEPKAVSGGAVVQIGAVSTTALADKAWSEAVAAAGGSGKGKSIEKIEKNGGVLYRTAVTGFASRADAQAFCGKLQSAGKSCFVR